MHSHKVLVKCKFAVQSHCKIDNSQGKYLFCLTCNCFLVIGYFPEMHKVKFLCRVQIYYTRRKLFIIWKCWLRFLKTRTYFRRIFAHCSKILRRLKSVQDWVYKDYVQMKMAIGITSRSGIRLKIDAFRLRYPLPIIPLVEKQCRFHPLLIVGNVSNFFIVRITHFFLSVCLFNTEVRLDWRKSCRRTSKGSEVKYLAMQWLKTLNCRFLWIQKLLQGLQGHKTKVVCFDENVLRRLSYLVE